MDRVTYTTPEAVIFFHIPKTAGVSLSRALLTQFASNAVYQIRRHDHEQVFSRRHGSPQEFQALLERERGQIRLLLGHQPFGLHKFLPGKATYVTVLRHPTERIISYFGHFNRNRALLRGQPPLSFEEFCRNRRQVENVQTRLLCGGKFAKHPGPESLARAKDNLERWFRVVGTTERLAETILAMEKSFGWGPLPFYRLNVGLHRPRAAAISAADLAHIQELNLLDQELYDFADQRLTARLQELGPAAIDRELAERRRQANAWYRLLGQRLESMARGVYDHLRMGLRRAA